MAQGLIHVFVARLFFSPIEKIPFMEYVVEWNIEYTDEFGDW